jgi:hypothetical protein
VITLAGRHAALAAFAGHCAGAQHAPGRRRREREGCTCECDACEDDDCEDCSNLACDDSDCQENGCPNQDQDVEENSLHRGTVAFKKTPADDKDKIDWSRYAQGFAWVDPENKDNFGGYKLPHHDVKNGWLVSVWGGAPRHDGAARRERWYVDPRG